MFEYSGRKFEAKYTLGQIVYHRAAPEQMKGVVSALRLYADGGMAYEIIWGDRNSGTCFEIELTDTFLKDFNLD